MSDDSDFVGSVLGVSGILGSPGITFGFLLGLSSGGGIEFLSGVVLSLLLDSQLLGDLDDLNFSISSGDGQSLSLFGHLSDEGLEVELSLGFSFSVVNEGLFEGGSQFSNLVLDGGEFLSGES